MSWLRLNLAAVEAHQEQTTPSVSGVGYPGSRVLVSGEPESLKSWLAAVVAVETDNQVVWVDFEQGPEVTRARFEALGLTGPLLESIHYIAPREPLGDEDRLHLIEDLAWVRPALTVFDAYAGLLGVHDLDPDSSRDIERVNRHVVDVFRDAGSTVLILDHVVKQKDARSRYAAGSGRKLAEVEVHIGCERIKHFARGTAGAARLRNHKDRLGGLPHPIIGELHLTSDPNTGAVTWAIRPPDAAQPTTTDSFRPTGLMERVSMWLEHQAEPQSRRAVERNVTGKTDYLRLACAHLVGEGYVTDDDGLVSVRPYREAQEATNHAG